MKAQGSIVVAPGPAGSGRPSTLRSAQSEPPFSIRECAGRVLIAASAAAPVGGDELSMDIAVLAGARADIGTVASTIVLPGPTGGRSTMTTTCSVGEGAHLTWAGEPTVSVAGSDHTVETFVDLAAGASCRIVEEVSLGRSGEPSGRLRLVIRVVRDGVPLVHHDELFGPDVPGAGSVVSTGGARHVLSEVVVGAPVFSGAPDQVGATLPAGAGAGAGAGVGAAGSGADGPIASSAGVDGGGGAPRVSIEGPARAAWLPMADDAALLLAVGPDRPAVLAAAARVST